MTDPTPHAPRPDHPPPQHRVVEHRHRHDDPFTPSHPPEPAAVPPEESRSAKGGLSAAMVGGLIALGVCLGLALVFTDLFR